jgi:hypothetical protein
MFLSRDVIKNNLLESCNKLIYYIPATGSHNSEVVPLIYFHKYYRFFW